METTAKSIDTVTARWKLTRVVVLALLALTFILVIAGIPVALALPAVFISALGGVFGALALFRTGEMWGRAALIALALLFSLSITFQLALGSILTTLPLLLLGYLMILFFVEAFDALSKHSQMHSREMLQLQASRAIPAIEKSLQHVLRKMARLGLMLGACYLLTLTAVSLGSYLASFSSLAPDTSIYIVAVSVSLALLLILREE